MNRGAKKVVEKQREQIAMLLLEAIRRNAVMKRQRLAEKNAAKQRRAEKRNKGAADES